MIELKKAPRGLRHYENAAPSVASGFLLMVAISSYIFWREIFLFKGWANLFQGLSALFGVPATVAISHVSNLAVTVNLPSAMPGIEQSSALVVVVGILAYLCSYALPPTRVPGRYSLRALGLVLALPAAGYYLLGIDPELDINAHVAQVFHIGYWFLILIPIIYAFTGFTLPGNIAKKTVLTLVTLVYFYVSIPLIAIFHWQVISLVGPAIMPAMNILFSVLLMSIHLIAFYGLIASTEE